MGILVDAHLHRAQHRHQPRVRVGLGRRQLRALPAHDDLRAGDLGRRATRPIVGWWQQQYGAEQSQVTDERIDGRIAFQWRPTDRTAADHRRQLLAPEDRDRHLRLRPVVRPERPAQRAAGRQRHRDRLPPGRHADGSQRAASTTAGAQDQPDRRQPEAFALGQSAASTPTSPTPRASRTRAAAASTAPTSATAARSASTWACA